LEALGEEIMKAQIIGALLAASVAAMAAVPAAAALHATDRSSVTFDATGPAGLKIHGKSGGVQLDDKGETLTFTAPTNAFVTGMSLRDSHLKGYLNVEKHPTATLVVPKSQVKVPSGAVVEATSQGTLTLNGVSKPVKVAYKATPSGKGYDVEANFTVNLPDFEIKQPCYLGVCVQNVVKVSVALVARDD
jgi:polyisoprenoid-binding protein YceI